MAVYTHLTADDLAGLIAEYDVGGLVSAKGIAEGVSNSNFLLETDAGRFILTVYERGPLRHLPAHGGYAWRLPLILWLTLLVASVSYAAIERPGMEWGRRLAQPLRQPQPDLTKERAVA